MLTNTSLIQGAARDSDRWKTQKGCTASAVSINKAVCFPGNCVGKVDGGNSGCKGSHVKSWHVQIQKSLLLLISHFGCFFMSSKDSKLFFNENISFKKWLCQWSFCHCDK
jgi:hypothetical protein